MIQQPEPKRTSFESATLRASLYSALVGVLSLVFTLYSSKEYETLVAFAVLAASLLIVACAVRWPSNQFRKDLKDFWGRRQELDLKDYRRGVKEFRLVFLALVRLIPRLWTPVTKILSLSVVTGVFFLAILRLYIDDQPGHGVDMYVHVFVLLIFLVSSVVCLAHGMRKKIQSVRPAESIMDEIGRLAKSWVASEPALPSSIASQLTTALRSEGFKNAATEKAARIAIADPGPIRVWAVNYYEWFASTENGWRLFD